jgi:hypothetical protein
LEDLFWKMAATALVVSGERLLFITKVVSVPTLVVSSEERSTNADGAVGGSLRLRLLVSASTASAAEGVLFRGAKKGFTGAEFLQFVFDDLEEEEEEQEEDRGLKKECC